jgi:hypothetical protein
MEDTVPWIARDGAITFRDIVGKLEILRVACDKCGRRNGREGLGGLSVVAHAHDDVRGGQLRPLGFLLVQGGHARVVGQFVGAHLGVTGNRAAFVSSIGIAAALHLRVSQSSAVEPAA